jgi:quercetin dioxygenase-like cupin family protein
MSTAAIAFHGGDAESGEVFMVETHAPAGYVLGQHEHAHAHLSYLVSGTALVESGGDVTRHVGPCSLVIPAKTAHKVTAVTDITWLCLWASHLGMQDEARESLHLIGA